MKVSVYCRLSPHGRCGAPPLQDMFPLLFLCRVLALALAVAGSVSAQVPDSGRRPVLPTLPLPPAPLLPGVRTPDPLAGAREKPAADAAPARPAASTAAPVAGATGRMTGRVLEAESGQAMSGVQVVLAGIGVGTTTDLDGRYLLPRVPAGRVTVLFRFIGYRPVRMDSVDVRPGATAIVNASLRTAPQTLQAVAVTAEAGRRADSDVGLLALQRAAPSVSDGISSVAMSRLPTANAADAIVRVPGVSVVSNRFVVVRGLAERYNATTLNGSELPSPEPTRRVVPLDIFPAPLLESIVTAKTATPDKPGDFSGGLVEIRTKEFPETFVAQMSVSQSAQDLTTGQRGPYPSRTLNDLLTLGQRSRPVPSPIPATTAPVSEQVAQSMRSEWTGPERAAPQNTGLEASFGGPMSLFGQPLGVVAAVTYSNELRRVPDRLFVITGEAATFDPTVASTINEYGSVADLGGIFNASYRPFSWTKLGLKNLYSRNTEDVVLTSSGFNKERQNDALIGFQRRFVLRDLQQTQLSGEHTFGFLRDARLEWRGTSSMARRDEPDNRQVYYSLGAINFVSRPKAQYRDLTDRALSWQGDLTLPFSVWRNDDASIKAGGQWRRKARDFDAFWLLYDPVPGARTSPVFQLPPNQAFAPENLGPAGPIVVNRFLARAQPYRARDEVSAWYLMADLPLRRWFRVVGGIRDELWALRLDVDPSVVSESLTVTRRIPDRLASVNVTVKFGDRTNLRFGFFDAVSRPEPRELSPDEYEPVLSECSIGGNPSLRRSRIRNMDARLEFYPALGEILSLSAFVKQFRDPIVENLSVGAGSCSQGFFNADSAQNVGAEFEVRRGLRFLPGALGERLFLGANVTWVQSRVYIARRFGVYDPNTPLAGQSPLLSNVSLQWGTPGVGTQASVLLNWFDGRVTRYGVASVVADTAQITSQSPNLVERGRVTLDAKVERRLWRGITASLSARNLLNARVDFFQPVPGVGSVVSARFPLGRQASVKVTYDF